MRRFLVICLFLNVCSLSQALYSQEPNPTVNPENETDVIKVSTTLIKVDVVVTDKKNRQVTNLKREDFELYENGKKQEITNFSYVSPKTKNRLNNSYADSLGLEDNKDGTSLKDKISIPTNPQRTNPNNISRTMVIVVDDIGLSFRSVKHIKNSIRKFIKEQIRGGDLVTIVTTGGTSVLPAFTSDKKQLLEIVKKIKWGPKSRGGIDYYEPIKPSLIEEVGDRNDPIIAAQIAAENALLEDVELARKNDSVVGTLGSLQYIISGMRNLPGRKSVVFFSEGFSLSNRTQRNSSNADKDTSGGISKPSAINRFGSGASDALKSLIKIANQSSVVIYTIDPRGLQNTGMAFADEDIRKAFGDDFKPGQTDDKRTSRDSDFRQTQDGLRVLASETGGFATLNQNNLNKGLKRIIEDQSYYLLGYVTTRDEVNSSRDAIEKVEIKVRRPNTTARYRSAFYSSNSVFDETNENQTPREKVGQALAYPFKANEIKLNLYSVVGNDKYGDFVRFLINISAKDLDFKKESKGIRKANFDMLAITLNAGGKPINQFVKNFTITVNEPTYRSILKKGFVYVLPVPLKRSGVYHFRVAIRDSKTGKVGAATKFLDTPKFEKKKLWISNLTLKSDSRNSKDPANQKKVFTDTTLRRFSLPSTLSYGAVIYNAKTKTDDLPNLTIRTRLIHNDKIILETPSEPILIGDQTDLARIDLTGTTKLKNNLIPGDYILQIIVTDELAKKKTNIATQWIDFEVTK